MVSVPTGRPNGRPSEYDASYCEKVVALGEEGRSRTQIAARLGCTKETLVNWEKAHPEFLCATSRARQLAQAWWEDQAHSGIWSKEFNANAYRLQVINRFPDEWKDRTSSEVSGPGGGPIETVTADASALANALLGVLAKAGTDEKSE